MSVLIDATGVADASSLRKAGPPAAGCPAGLTEAPVADGAPCAAATFRHTKTTNNVANNPATNARRPTGSTENTPT